MPLYSIGITENNKTLARQWGKSRPPCVRKPNVEQSVNSFRKRFGVSADMLYYHIKDSVRQTDAKEQGGQLYEMPVLRRDGQQGHRFAPQ